MSIVQNIINTESLLTFPKISRQGSHNTGKWVRLAVALHFHSQMYDYAKCPVLMINGHTGVVST